MKHPVWTRRPSKISIATNEGWQQTHLGRTKIVRPHKGLLNALIEAGYDCYGNYVGDKQEDKQPEVAVDVVVDVTSDVSPEIESQKETENKSDDLTFGNAVTQPVETIKRGRGRPRKDGGIKA